MTPITEAIGVMCCILFRNIKKTGSAIYCHPLCSIDYILRYVITQYKSGYRDWNIKGNHFLLNDDSPYIWYGLQCYSLTQFMR